MASVRLGLLPDKHDLAERTLAHHAEEVEIFHPQLIRELLVRHLGVGMG